MEGFAALLAYDPAAGAEANVASMSESAARVVPAEVTRAVRDSVTDAGEVHEGDWIGLSRDGVVAVADNVVVCTRLLLSRLLDDDARAGDAHRGRGRDARPTRGGSTSGCPRSTPTSRSRCTTAASRSTRTCSGSSSGRTPRAT